MRFCGKCGNPLPDDAHDCLRCGATANDQYAEVKSPKRTFSDFFQNILCMQDYTEQYSPEDISHNDGMALLAYLGVLVLIPLFAAKDSPYARFHTNQGLLMFLAGVLCNLLGWAGRSVSEMAQQYSGLIGSVLSVLSVVLGIVGLIRIVPVICRVIGIYNTFQHRARELPIIGTIRIIR